VILELLPELVDGADEPLDLPSEPSLVAGAALSTVALRLHHELVDPDGPSPLALEGLALEAVAACRPRRNRAFAKPRWLSAVNELLDAHYVSPPTIAQLGAIIGVHPTHLARAYPKATGERIGEAVRRRRLDASLRLLLTTDRALSDIALACGFCDQSHFTRLFGRTFGRTPARFRQGHGLTR
jgi:AraC family transcriptional regulator